jgi:hypothetical protein
MIRIVLAIGLALCMVAVTGCRRASESATEKFVEKMIEKNGGGKANVDINKGKFTVKTKEGEFEASTGEGATLPAKFPKDVMVYKSAKILVAMTNPQGFAVTLQTGDNPDKVAEKYKAEMASQGWKEEATMNMGGQIVLSYSKETRRATVGIGKDDEGAHISLTVTSEEKESKGEQESAETKTAPES